jgi:hypothetical protein
MTTTRCAGGWAMPPGSSRSAPHHGVPILAARARRIPGSNSASPRQLSIVIAGQEASHCRWSDGDGPPFRHSSSGATRHDPENEPPSNCPGIDPEAGVVFLAGIAGERLVAVVRPVAAALAARLVQAAVPAALPDVRAGRG